MGLLILTLLRVLGWVYYLMPWPMRRLWVRALGDFLRFLSLRASVVEQNLEIAFPRDEESRRRIFPQAYYHLSQLALEILMLLGPMPRYVKESCEFRGWENWKKVKDSGRGVIFLSSHVGNWELMAATGWIHGEVDTMLVTKHLKPEWLHRAIERGRKACGVVGTYEPRTMKDVLRHLKNKGSVGFVLDQYAGPPVGVRVPVFGVPVSTATTVAMLAKRTGAAVIPALNYRAPDGHLILELHPEVPWIPHEDPTYELALNTAEYAKIVESHIRAHPDQWLWIHRRFKGDLSPLREGEWSMGRART